MLTWLCCDKQQRYVKSLWCETCRQFQDDRIHGTKNFSAAWITGSTNQKLSNVLNHACSNQHKLSMSLLRVEQAKGTNRPVTRTLRQLRAYCPWIDCFGREWGRSLTFATCWQRRTYPFVSIQQSMSWRAAMELIQGSPMPLKIPPNHVRTAQQRASTVLLLRACRTTVLQLSHGWN